MYTGRSIWFNVYEKNCAVSVKVKGYWMPVNPEHMTGYAGSRDSDPLFASSVRVFCALNSQRAGRSLPGQGRDHLFQWVMGISVGFFTETTGNPETRRNPSYTKYK